MLYLRKQPRQGVITRPSGSVTDVFPSYQCCSSFGSSSGTPVSLSGSFVWGFLPPNLPPIIPAVRQWLDESTLGEEISSSSPSAEECVEHTVFCVHQLSSPNRQVVNPVHGQPM